MKKIMPIWVCMILTILSCGQKQMDRPNPGFFATGFEMFYRVNLPDSTIYMKRELSEISGLTYSTGRNVLYAINDEKGNIYSLDSRTGEILDEIDFGKKDDYEGVAYHEGKIYVVESNGNVKVVDESKAEKTKEYDDKLSDKNDIEGMEYNPVTQTMLLAAKGDSEVDGNKKKHKAIFMMSLSDGNVSEKPFLLINPVEEAKEMESRYLSDNVIINVSVTSRLRNYGPSGIAVHPVTKDIYILSARGKTLTIVNQAGKIQAIVFMRNSKHVQPEGICFAPDGTMYISNEGRGRKGCIYVYKMQQNIQESEEEVEK